MVAKRFENSLIPLFCSWTQYYEVFMFSTGHWKVWKDLSLCFPKMKRIQQYYGLHVYGKNNSLSK